MKPNPAQANSLQPIISLIGKSEKAKQKLAAGTWQHAMLERNLSALHIALALMNRTVNDMTALTRADLQAALCAFADMRARSEKAQAKFAPGTSHYHLQQNRLNAFRTAEMLINAQLK